MTWFITWSSHQNSVFKAVRKPISPSFNSWVLKILAKVTRVTRVTRVTDYHLQGAHPSKWSFARCQILRMIIWRGKIIWEIICKWPVPPDDRLQAARSSGWSLERGWSFLMIICKRPIHPDDFLQEAGPSRWSFARGHIYGMIICKRMVPSDDPPKTWWRHLWTASDRGVRGCNRKCKRVLQWCNIGVIWCNRCVKGCNEV